MIAAVVPAAGKSERMGQPKLLLTLDGQTLIARVVRALCSGGADLVLVVTPPAGTAESPELAKAAEEAGAAVIVPSAAPADMRASVELALEKLGRGAPPQRVLLAPADSPGITSDLVRRLLEQAARHPEQIVIPCCDGRRGHPIVLPWAIAQEVRSLPIGLGVNALVARHARRTVELPVLSPEVAADLDTPEDLRFWRETIATGSRFTVRLFALARERAGRSEVEVELPPAPRVADLRVALRERVPELGPLLPSVLIAVDEEYADDTAPIAQGARIAVIPPVSGGARGRGERNDFASKDDRFSRLCTRRPCLP